MTSFFRSTRYRPLEHKGQEGEPDEPDPEDPSPLQQPERERSFLGRLFNSRPDTQPPTAPTAPGETELQEVSLRDDDSDGPRQHSPTPPLTSDDEMDLEEQCNEQTPLAARPHSVNLHVSGKPATAATPCDLNWTIGDAKRFLFPKDYETKRIRMISRGKLLDNDNATLKDFVEDGGHIHVSVTERRRPGEGEENGSIEPVDADENQLLEDLRLARVLQFGHADEWDGDENQSREGTNAEFVLFFVAGMLLGFIMLIFLFQARLTRKKKLGILVGISIHVIVNVSGSEGFISKISGL